MRVVDAGDEEEALLGNNPSAFSTLKKLMIVVFCVVTVGTVATVTLSSLTYVQTTPTVSETKQCSVQDFKVDYNPFYGGNNQDNSTSRFSVPPDDALIRNVIIWTVNSDDQELANYDILVLQGVISQIAQNIPTPVNFPPNKIYDGTGRYLTPGLVDMHSHVGVSSFPEDSRANDDTNEIPSNPLYPQLRAIDGLNPNDPAIALLLGGGITTSLVLPGSGNLMGGEAAYVKLRGNSVKEMLIPEVPRAFKMACGENPKRIYSALNVSPNTRLGAGWLFRKKFYDAAVLRAQQQQWDCQNDKNSTFRPESLELEPLVAVLEGQAKLMVHCYKVEDMEMMIRTSDELNFKVNTFHHASEAWKLRFELSERNISVATWPDHWGFKMESYDGSVQALTLLLQAGVATILKTDHPVVYGKYFMYEAAKAHHWGLSWQQAIRAVTMTPAESLGISDRVGSVQVNKDADLVIWDRNPLDIGAVPTHVFVEGHLLVTRNTTSPVPDPEPAPAVLSWTGPYACQSGIYVGYVVRGATAYTLDIDVIVNATVVVGNDGILQCIGEYPVCESQVHSNFSEYYAEGGWIIPGLINTGAWTGQNEVDSEVNSEDGKASVANGANIKAVDGIRLSSYLNRHIVAAFLGGVTTVVATPQGTQLVGGQSAAFHSIPDVLIDDALISHNASLDVHLGNSVSSSGFTSFSSQIAELRSLFNKAKSAGNLDEYTQPFRDVLDKKIPLVAYVHQLDQINSVIRFKNEFGIDVVINGGAEAHGIAGKLAVENVSVILNPMRQPPNGFETWNVNDQSAIILARAGVKVGLSLTGNDAIRTLRWEAGMVSAGGLDFEEALRMVTKNTAEMYKIDNLVGSIIPNARANFVVFSGNPLTLKSNVLLVAVGNYVSCEPEDYKK